MQTFLPYSCFQTTASCLDWRRLGKQRVEAFQILNILRGLSEGWANHPAVKMWEGYNDALAVYMNCCISEWIARGYKNNMKLETVKTYKLPEWIGWDKFHASHRSNLLRKDSVYYGCFGWDEPNDLPYIWPKNSPQISLRALP